MPSTAIDISDPGLADAMLVLATALREHGSQKSDAPSYLDMATMADRISDQLHELARCLVSVARSDEKATWTEVGEAFGVTRQAAMRRWSPTA